jgi:hypothetical protein
MKIRRSSLVLFFLALVSYLFVSVVYACSGLGVMQMTFMSAPMDDRAVERGPCDKHKQDVCKSVRDRMLSIQPYKIDVEQPILLLLPPNLVIGLPKHIASLSAPVGWEADFHSVFKLPLHLSFSVLRI